MAKRRMFCVDVTYDDKFLDMSYSAQLLYFHLGMQADDEGFFPSPIRVGRTMGLPDPKAALQELEENGFIISFDTGIIVISHWKVNNQIRKDRFTETNFKKERRKLFLDDSVYRLKQFDDNQMTTNCQPNEGGPDTQYSTVQDSTVQSSAVKANGKTLKKKAPSIKDCKAIIRKMFEVKGMEYPNAEYTKAVKTIREVVVNFGLSLEDITACAVWKAESDRECRPSEFFKTPSAFMKHYNQFAYGEPFNEE